MKQMLILGYVLQFLPLLMATQADFADDKTAADRKASVARSIGNIITAGVAVIAGNNPKYAAELNEITADVQALLAKYTDPPKVNTEGV